MKSKYLELKTSTTKLFAAAICDKCNRVEHWETKDYSECAYESSKMLSSEELKEAIDNGNVTFSEHYGSCEGCAEDAYSKYLQSEHELLEAE